MQLLSVRQDSKELQERRGKSSGTIDITSKTSNTEVKTLKFKRREE